MKLHGFDHARQMSGSAAHLAECGLGHQHHQALPRVAAQQVALAQIEQQLMAHRLEPPGSLCAAVLLLKRRLPGDAQHQHAAGPFGSACSLGHDLAAQVARVGELGLAVQRPVVAEQPLALVHVLAQHGLLLAPQQQAQGQQQDADTGEHRFRPPEPGPGIGQEPELVERIAPRGQRQHGEPTAEQARHLAIGPAVQHQHSPGAGQQRQPCFAGDVDQAPFRCRPHRPQLGEQHQRCKREKEQHSKGSWQHGRIRSRWRVRRGQPTSQAAAANSL